MIILILIGVDLVIDMYEEIVLEQGVSAEYYVNDPVFFRDDNVTKEEIEEDPEVIQEEDPEEDQILNVLNEINEKIGVLENDDRDSEPVQVVISPDNFRCNNVSSNEIISLSENIINKPLNNYTVTESLLALVVVAVFVAGLAYVIKRSVFRWN